MRQRIVAIGDVLEIEEDGAGDMAGLVRVWPFLPVAGKNQVASTTRTSGASRWSASQSVLTRLSAEERFVMTAILEPAGSARAENPD